MTFLDISILIGVVVVVSLSVHLIHRHWPYTKRQKHNDVAGFIFAAIAVCYPAIVNTGVNHLVREVKARENGAGSW
jgi:hypothetical protein